MRGTKGGRLRRMGKAAAALLLAALWLLPLLPPVRAADTDRTEMRVRVRETDIRADECYNTGGYGAVKIQAACDEATGAFHIPQTALVDKTGAFLFPYQETWREYHCSDGIISLTTGQYSRTYRNRKWVSGDASAEPPAYYRLDGSPAFTQDFTSASPMKNGNAIVFDDWELNDAEGLSAFVINDRGETVFTLPRQFTEGLRSTDSDWGESLEFLWWEKERYYAEDCGDGLILCAVREPIAPGQGGAPVREYDYMDLSGRIVLKLDCCSYATPFYGGYAAVVDRASKKCGIIDRSGKEVLPCVYDSLGIYRDRFPDGLMPVCLNEKWGCVNIRNEIVVPLEYDYAYGGEDGLVPVGRNGKYGLVNERNQVVVPLVYDSISRLENGAAYAVQNGKLVILTVEEDAGGELEFLDVSENAYYADAVAWAVGSGITSGRTADTFAPSQPCTRAQIVTFLWRAMGSPEPRGGEDLFVDVPSGAYYAKAVLWARENGITSGRTAETFEPGNLCTRAQVITFLWRSQGMPRTVSTERFLYGDVPSGSYYADAVAWAAENGITSGSSTEAFHPGSVCTRAQAVTFLYRALGQGAGRGGTAGT